ncbi:MAG: hypothetical protein QOE45_2882 [Frankiaceae bacterium]|jgi:hypothetical protein|nr:hypothetical protein [Frankiaceae bacterium]
MAKRTLSLRRETLTELDTTELTEVVGGQVPSGVTCPVLICLDVSRNASCIDCITRMC